MILLILNFNATDFIKNNKKGNMQMYAANEASILNP